MRLVLLVAGQELVVNLRRPAFIILTLLIPALGGMVFVMSSMFRGQVGGVLDSQLVPSHAATGFVDLSGLLIADLPQYGGDFLQYPDEASARAELLAGKIGSYYVVAEDYLQTGKVRFVVSGRGASLSLAAAADNEYMSRFLVDHLLAGTVDEAVRDRVRKPMDVEPLTLSDGGNVGVENPLSWLGDFLIPYVFSILFVVTLFTASGFLLQGVAEEKEGRIIEILLSSISPTQLLTGKILGLGALGMIQILIWMAAGALLLTASVASFALAGVITLQVGTLALVLVYFVLGYLLFATLMAVAGSMGTTARESQQIAGIFTLSAAIPWMAMGVLFANPDATIIVILSYFPLTSPVMMLLRLGFAEVPTEQIAISLALLVAGIAFSLWAGVKIFRMGLLMYGKRPGPKDLLRAFRQA
jgi:ABC-2 type transport system permease protein